MYSPIGRSAQFCRVFLRFLYVIVEVSIEDWQLYNRDLYWDKDDINAIFELPALAVKHDDLELDLFINSVLDAFIEFLCTK